jgi:hypothetical protein
MFSISLAVFDIHMPIKSKDPHSVLVSIYLCILVIVITSYENGREVAVRDVYALVGIVVSASIENKFSLLIVCTFNEVMT